MSYPTYLTKDEQDTITSVVREIALLALLEFLLAEEARLPVKHANALKAVSMAIKSRQ